ncbi:MAG: PEP-CTERM sorting domain-containing protein [Phycisphaerae bacterium]
MKHIQSAAAVAVLFLGLTTANASVIGDTFDVRFVAGTTRTNPAQSASVLVNNANLMPAFGSQVSVGEIYNGQPILLETTETVLGGNQRLLNFTFTAPDLLNDGKPDPIIPTSSKFFPGGVNEDGQGIGTAYDVTYFQIQFGNQGNRIESSPGNEIDSVVSSSVSLFTSDLNGNLLAFPGVNPSLVSETTLATSLTASGGLAVAGVLGVSNNDVLINFASARIVQISFDVVVTTIPEPTTLLSVFLGTGGLLLRRR